MARQKPRISIVMPSFQQREFIAEAIQSVFAQDIDAIELIVADGGSSDGTPGYLAELAQQHRERLRWRSAPDRGPAHAINQAIARAEAPLIGWLNSDDRYTEGAIERALRMFDANPELVMVYGEGEHIGLHGNSIGRYPTRPPSTPTSDFAAGCFICQPTAFFTRAAFISAGGLDESLRTAFDFDLWLKLFTLHPGRIGFVPEVQAHSRLHTETITSRQRELVALEGLAILRKYLDLAPPHWLLNYFRERLEGHPFASDVSQDLLGHFENVVARAQPLLDTDGTENVRQHLATHAGIAVSTLDIGCDIHGDGWTGSRLAVRVRQPASPRTTLRLQGLSARPDNAPVRVVHRTDAGQVLEVMVPGNQGFEFDVPLGDPRPGAQMVLHFECVPTFVPRELDAQSGDARVLGFRVLKLELTGNGQLAAG